MAYSARLRKQTASASKESGVRGVQMLPAHMGADIGGTGEEDHRDDRSRDDEQNQNRNQNPEQPENPSIEPDGPRPAEPQDDNDDNHSTSDQGLPPVQDLPVTPGQLLRFVVKPVDHDAAGKKEHPQIRINKFWSNFEPEYQGGVTQILPEPLLPKSKTKSKISSNVDKPANSYQKARDKCIKSVKRIIRECRALNQKYTDIHFDVERDLKMQVYQDCLFGLNDNTESKVVPQDVKRVTEICEKPMFFKDGATFDDIVQGSWSLDCWFLAALSALTANQQLIEDLCVIRDEEIGVYGFVFYRDGEWQPCIIDDKLYLKAPSFDESADVILGSYYVEHKDQEKKYRETFQSGSKALFFGACRDDNETWVPLLEKAFAKAHGDYAALNWGKTGEALEDLTGGVSTELYTHNILNKDRFWTETLSHIGKDYVFSCATAPWLDARQVFSQAEEATRDGRRKGVVSSHAYAVLATYEGFGERLVKVRNPWGKREWNGAWSDGSKEWTSEWVDRLKHKFGDDGVFWISYDDLLQRYRYLDYTRIFGAEWHVTQQWAQVQVPWNIRDYQQTTFAIDVPTATETVIVLSQLDDRYFRGLEGTYNFVLQFRLQKDDKGEDDDQAEDEDDYIVRSKLNYNMQRSTNVTIDLEPGKYTLLFKAEAFETNRDDIETVIRENIDRKNKITQMATLYDLAHAKGRRPEKVKVEPDTKTQPIQANNIKEDVKKDSSNEQKTTESASVKDENKSSEAATQTDVRDTEKSTGGEDKAKADQDPKAADEKATQTEDVKRAESVRTAPARGERSPSPPPTYLHDSDSESDDEDDPQRNPWNAFCTVGLRVYSKTADLKITVVYADDEAEQVPTLDGDDIAKAALAEVEAKVAAEKKEEAAKDEEKAETEKKDGSKTEEPRTQNDQSAENYNVKVAGAPILSTF